MTTPTKHPADHPADHGAATQHPATGHAPAAPLPDHDPPAPAPAPAPKPYVVPKTLAGGKAALELQIVHTAGGDVKFIVVSVTNALEPAPGAYLTLEQVEAIGAAGWTVTAIAR